jgi:hypothetical protein
VSSEAKARAHDRVALRVANRAAGGWRRVNSCDVSKGITNVDIKVESKILDDVVVLVPDIFQDRKTSSSARFAVSFCST